MENRESNKTRESFFIKMILDRYILNVDLSGLQKIIIITWQLSNNLNQASKDTTISENIYKDKFNFKIWNYSLNETGCTV